MTQFYVTLPSDSSINYFPDNTVAHYKTKLAKRICTDGDYEVAITELIYPMKIHKCVFKEPLVISTAQRDRNGLFMWELKSGDFKDVNALATFLNDELTKKLERAHGVRPLENSIFRYDEMEKRWIFEFKGAMTMGDTSVRRFDWSPYRVGLQSGFIRFLEEPFELPQLHLMYIYSDIVDPSLVGDVHAPLMRVVALRGERDEMITMTFDKPYYLPVTRRDIDQIEILLNTELGTLMPFTGGKSLVILHFRQRHESLLSNAAFG